jgi:hypothetical protein
MNVIKSCKGNISLYYPNTDYKPPTQRHITYYDCHKYTIYEPLYWDFNIEDFFNQFNITDINSLVYGTYELQHIIDHHINKKNITADQLNEIIKYRHTQNKKIFVNIFETTDINKIRKNTYPSYFIYDICSKIPEYYKNLSLLDNNKFIIVPNSEKNYSSNINSPCVNPTSYFNTKCQSYIFNCYFKDNDFISELENEFKYKQIIFSDILTKTKYKYYDMFQLNLSLLLEVRDVIFYHFAKFNIPPNNIYIYVSHSNTYLNFVYLTIYIIDPSTLNYVSFLDFNTFQDINILIKLHELKSIQDIKLNYTINIEEDRLKLLDPNTYLMWNLNENNKNILKYDGINDFMDVYKEYKKNPSNIEIIHCKYYKNIYHSYCDKSMLIRIKDQLYEFSIKNITFDKLSNNGPNGLDNSYRNIYQKALNKIDNRNTFNLFNNIYNRHHILLPAYFSILCTKTILLDSQGLINILDIRRRKGENDILSVIAIILYKYHSYTNKILCDNLLQQIPFIYINLYDLYNNTYVRHNSFIAYSRIELSMTVSNEMATFYKNKNYDISKLKTEKGYKLLWHAPDSYHTYFNNENFTNKFRLLLQDIKTISEPLLFKITHDTSNQQIQDILSNIYNMINDNDIVRNKLKEVVNYETIYPYVLNEQQYKKIFRDITDAEKKELYDLINTGDYSDIIMTIPASTRFRIFHAQLIMDYSSYKGYVGHYLALPNRKISIMNCFNNNIQY